MNSEKTKIEIHKYAKMRDKSEGSSSYDRELQHEGGRWVRTSHPLQSSTVCSRSMLLFHPPPSTLIAERREQIPPHSICGWQFCPIFLPFHFHHRPMLYSYLPSSPHHFLQSEEQVQPTTAPLPTLSNLHHQYHSLPFLFFSLLHYLRKCERR